MTPRAYSYIRFSTPEQLKGDSLRRQVQASEEYARQHGLELDNTLRLQDVGLSAFKGLNKTQGALSEFLKLISDGRIAKGSFLLIESLDRLSREGQLIALDLLRGITEKGVKVVTLTDGYEYTHEGIGKDIGQLIMSLVIMSRAHEESATKSERLKAAWENKRNNIDDKKLTARAPLWLKLSKDKKSFIPYKDRVAVIEEIFKMKLQGKGSETIERELNNRQVWAPKNGWRKSYINKILRNRGVIGEYQPHKKIEAKRVPLGEPISNYYPAIIAEDLFLKVQSLIKTNGEYGGKNGAISNLFGHIAKCGYCHSPMRLVNKGIPPKGGSYYICDNAKRGITCHSHYVRYDKIEDVILEFCKGLSVNDILQDDSTLTELQQLQDALLVTDEKLKGLDGDIKNIIGRIQKTRHENVADALEEKLNILLSQQDKLQNDKDLLKNDIDQKSTIQNSTSMQLKQMSDLINLMNDRGRQKEIRLKLRDRIRTLIDRIDVFPVGTTRMTEQLIEQAMQDLTPVNTPEELETIRNELESRVDNRGLLTLQIRFKTGSIRTLQPHKPEKLKMAYDFDREKGTWGFIQYDKTGKGKFIEKAL